MLAADTIVMSKSFSSLKNHFLIAMPQMADPNFSGTLTYICEHNEDGAMGIIFNRPSPLFLGEILAQLDYDFKGERSNAIVYEGGPVQQDRGFVLHTDKRKWKSNLSITEDMHLTTSKDILEAIADNDGPDTFLIALGYAGWGSGQLEKELIENTWLTCQAETDTLFHTENGDKFAKAVGQLGIDINQLSSQSGHA